MKPFLRTAALWVTAARPDPTLSDEVFGPWQAPAMSTPSTTVSTGRSLGWISLKNPSDPAGSLRTPASSSFLRGTMPVTRTTRSTGIASSASSVSRSCTVTVNWPPSSRTTAGGASWAYLRKTDPASRDSV